VLELLCKYAPRGGDLGHNHRGGPRREEAVHRAVIPVVGMPVPRFYGAHTDPDGAHIWLVSEFVARGMRFSRWRDPALALVRAAEWIGRFHALAATRIAGGAEFPLPAYDERYYAGWARRTAAMAPPVPRRPPWLDDLCGCWASFAAPLLAEPATVVHGEYYPANVLFDGDGIHPVDWESAALACGEIDLATLTDGWPEEPARRCEDAYCRARWPAPPNGFAHTLAAARVYVHLRWLGDRPEWTRQRASERRFTELLRNARRLGLVQS
jgi:aminoglycoside phosphotransferase (APT) family kinase protein